MALQFNDVSGGQGICQEIDDLCDSDENSYTLASKARRANIALEELELMALMADGTWQFDDKNYSAQPSGVQSAVAGTQEYDFDSTLLFIERVEILLSDGITWQKLDPMNEMEEEFALQNTIDGTPTKYYKRGNKFGFNNIPRANNMTLTSGIKVFFKRTGSLFTASDTTKTPGIVSPFHVLVAQKASLPYCKSYKKDRVAQLVLDIDTGQKNFVKYMASRSKDEEGQMTMERIDPR